MNFLLVILFVTSAFAQTFELESKILTPSQIQKLIGPMLPKKGSSEEKKDFETLFLYQKTRTDQDCLTAAADMDTSLKGMFGGEHKILTDQEVKKMNRFLIKAKISTGIDIGLSKKLFKRPRPYVANSSIQPCIDLESSYSFPSGHSLLMRVFANILAKVYPERTKMLLNRADQYALSRVIGGVHHPSDIEASKVLGDYLAKRMMNSEDFERLLDSL